MTLKLQRAPKDYDQTDQSRLRTQIEQNDLRILKSGQDVVLVNGERFFQSYAFDLVAHAGGGQASALKLSARQNHIGTVATSGDSLALMPAVAGLMQTIIHRGSASAQVYGQGSDTINGAAAGTGVAQAANTVVTYYCPINGQWFA